MTPTSTRRRRTKVRRTRGRRTGVLLGWVLIGCVALVAVAGVWTAVDALRVRDQLVEAASVVPQLEDQVLAGDDEAVAASVAALREAASGAVTTTGRPHWTLTSWLPGVGPNVRAVQILAGTVSDLAEGPLPNLPAVVAAASPAALAPQDGRVDVQSVAEAAPVVIAADDGVNAAIDSLAAINRNALWPQVSDAVNNLAAELSDLRLSTATASRAVQLIPPMMGIDGPRDYLVLVQNNAEPRALGGIVGAVLVLSAENGHVRLREQVPGNTISFSQPVVDLTDTEKALFGTQLGRYMLNVTSVPDFPRAASIAREMWIASGGSEVDGVLSIDPVALAGLLKATGPIETNGGTILDENNAAQYLLNGVYLDEPDPDKQDLFFAQAAGAIFEALTGGGPDATTVLNSLATSTDSGRVMLWSAHPSEAEIIANTSLAGYRIGDMEDSRVGVFVNDGTGAKAGYYLNIETEVDVMQCRPDGTALLNVATTLSSEMPEVSALPPYVTGGGVYAPEGEIRTNVALYAPQGGGIRSVASDVGELAILSQIHEGAQVALSTVVLRPGEKVTVNAEIVAPARGSDPQRVLQTPGPVADRPFSTWSCGE